MNAHFRFGSCLFLALAMASGLLGSCRCRGGGTSGIGDPRWRLCNRDEDVLLYFGACGEPECFHRRFEREASRHHDTRRVTSDCARSKPAPFPKVRCSWGICETYVDPTETPDQRSARARRWELETLRRGLGEERRRWQALLSLQRLGPPAVPLATEVRACLKDRSSVVRAEAARALLAIGKYSPQEEAHLRVASLWSSMVTVEEARALARHADRGSELAQEIMVVYQQSSNGDVVLVALSALGSSARGAAPRLLDEYDKASTERQRRLMAAVCAIEPKASKPSGFAHRNLVVRCNPPRVERKQ